MKKIIFWIGVNVIGIPEAFVHEIKSYETKSNYFSTRKKTTVNQYYL